MKTDLQASFQYCQRIAQSTGNNFAFTFRPLPSEKRQAMYALYAFFHLTDQIADQHSAQSIEETRTNFHDWKAAFFSALQGDYQHEVFPAIIDTIERYSIPQNYFQELFQGIEMDLDQQEYHTFAELELYCYRVASVVGLACLHVWGFEGGKETLELGKKCGIAFQLTNILRDIKEDFQRGRIYLPREDFQRFGFSFSDSFEKCNDENHQRFQQLMTFQIARAEAYYQASLPLARFVDASARPTLQTMMQTYHGLLKEIEQQSTDVLTKRVSLSRWKKFRIVVSAFLRWPRDEQHWLSA